jgi:hypothetical protein
MTELPADIAAAIDTLQDKEQHFFPSAKSIRDARAALDAAILRHIGGGWQPIATAPKDGTWILLTGGRIEYGWCQDEHPRCVVGQAVSGGENGWQFAWYDGGYYGEYIDPTHWMPLPDAPTAAPIVGTEMDSTPEKV